MKKQVPSTTSRRTFLANAGRMAAVSTLAGAAVPHVHAAENNTIRLALIGCGGRGTGAAADALNSEVGPTQLVAMADAFGDRLNSSRDALQNQFKNKVDVPKERQFVGLDGYKNAIDCLKPGDVAIFGTGPAFRWVHFAYAVQKGVNVFMEKPVTVDGPTTKRMFQQAEEATKKNLKVGVGLMVRHCRSRQALKKRIDDGEIGEITMLRTYRIHVPPVGYAGPKPKNVGEVEWQIRKFHNFIWGSGGVFSDFNIHFIDECCWMKGSWPVEAIAVGGRHYRDNGPDQDQNFDTYDIEYTFADGTKLFFMGRYMAGCYESVSSYAHGTKGLGIISSFGHMPGKCRTFKGHKMTKGNQLWAFPQPEKSPYQLEWDDLLTAIRTDKPYNEVQRGAEASLVTSMGRYAAHTGQAVTYKDFLNHPHEMAPNLDKLTLDGPAPIKQDAEGKYPVPKPGILKDREY